MALAGQQIGEQCVDFGLLVEELEIIKDSVSKIEVFLGELREKGTASSATLIYPTKKLRVVQEENPQKGARGLNALHATKRAAISSVDKVEKIDLSDVSERNHYKNILLLIERSEREKAEKSLNQFVGRFPESRFLDDAYYFLGNLHLTKKQYKAALISFVKSYQADRTGVRAPLALVKSIGILRSIGDYNHACSILQKALKEFSSNSTVKIQLKKEKEVLASHCENVIQEFE